MCPWLRLPASHAFGILNVALFLLPGAPFQNFPWLSTFQYSVSVQMSPSLRIPSGSHPSVIACSFNTRGAPQNSHITYRVLLLYCITCGVPLIWKLRKAPGPKTVYQHEFSRCQTSHHETVLHAQCQKHLQAMCKAEMKQMSSLFGFKTHFLYTSLCICKYSPKNLRSETLWLLSILHRCHHFKS